MKEVFPKRKLTVDRNKIIVKSNLASESVQSYQPNQLSDGELVSFYMIARILDSTAKILIIDEPEIHLHPFLAKSLWDALEDARPDIKFIYITHDYSFAESRREADYLIVRPGQEPEVLKNGNSFPPEFLHLLLGAVSADIKVDKIAFCEGSEGGKDDRIYSSWFSSSKIKVIPVGSCDRVKACYEAIKSGIVQDLTPIAIIDRDFRTADEINELNNLGIHVLPIHELESIFGIKDIFIVIAKHLGKTEDEANQAFTTFQGKAKASLASATNKVILERSKRQAMRKAQNYINSVPCANQFDEMNTKFQAAIININTEISQTDLMTEEKQKLDDAIQSSWDKVLEYFPGKIIISKVEEVLATDKSVLISLVEKSLKTSATSFSNIKAGLETALQAHFPSK